MQTTNRRRSTLRQGTTTLEAAVVLPVCLLLLIGMLELSLALIRHAVMSETARRVAREALVHGAKASPAQGQWGPAEISTSAAADVPAAASARDMLMTIDPAEVSLNITWPDGGNQPDQRVCVTVEYTHHPLIAIPAWYTQLEMRAGSTMRIAH